MEREYELTVVLKPDLPEEEREETLKKIEGMVEVTKRQDWGDRELAYPIRKHTRGLYIYMECKMEASERIREFMNMEPRILRYLIVRKEELKPARFRKAPEIPEEVEEEKPERPKPRRRKRGRIKGGRYRSGKIWWDE